MSKIGSKLEAIVLNRQGLSVGEIAEKLNKSTRTIQRYLKEKKVEQAKSQKG